MRIECGPVRLEFYAENVKHCDGGAVIVYLMDKTGQYTGNMYLSPKEVSIIRNRIRQVDTNHEGINT